LSGSKCSVRYHCASLNNKRVIVLTSFETGTLCISNRYVVQPPIVYRT
jgi:hypothetical protein